MAHGKFDKRAAFARSIRGLAAQGFKRAMSDQGSKCLYLAPDKCKCAIGHLLDEGEYVPEFETMTGVGVMQLLGWNLDFDDANFIRVLQQAHDFGSTPEAMKQHLRTLYQWWDLPHATELHDVNS